MDILEETWDMAGGNRWPETFLLANCLRFMMLLPLVAVYRTFIRDPD